MALMACAWSAEAQSRSKLKINEVMVQNENSIVDNYGRHLGWIELYNSDFAPMKINKIFMTTDSTQPKMYTVPEGVATMGKRSHVVFYVGGNPNNSAYHTNLVLDPTKENTIFLFDSDGINIIDKVTVPANIGADNSYARKRDGKVELDAEGNDISWEVRDDAENTDQYITPGSNNKIIEVNNKIENFKEKDEHGFVLTIMAMCIVFSALAVLCICFMIINKIFARLSGERKMKAHGIDSDSVAKADRPAVDSGEEIAAIAMALRDHLEAHDTESTVLTINKVKKAYSPWSSKIYSMRELPRR